MHSDPHESRPPSSSNEGHEAPASAAEPGSTSEDDVNRRDFVSAATTTAMAGGLVAGYGTFGVMAVRFLFAPQEPLAWQFVASVHELELGASLTYTAPNGSKIVVARQHEGTGADDFIALSSVCPHLGCAVHWEPQNDRFFCPCHNGVFDPQGIATAGPPAKAKQQLLQFPLKVEDDLLYIQVPLESIAQVDTRDPGEDTAWSTSPDENPKQDPANKRQGDVA